MARVYSSEKHWRVETALYRLVRVDPAAEQRWTTYAAGVLGFSFVGVVLLYLLQRLQPFLPLAFGRGVDGGGVDGVGVPPAMAFNTAVSFVTNTNWQSYGGETTLSHFSQMAGLTVQNFVSAGTGIALAVAFVRAFARSRADAIGNFWVDLTRANLYVLLPISIVFALFLVWQGMPQTLAANAAATTLEGGEQTLALGPVASQVAIKMLGTNGGGLLQRQRGAPVREPNSASELRADGCDLRHRRRFDEPAWPHGWR